MSFSRKVTLCSMPARVLDELARARCVVKIADGVVSFVDVESGKRIVAMRFGPEELRTEMALIRDGVVAYTLPIESSMKIDPESFEKAVVRKKKARKDKSKTEIDPEEIDADRLGIADGPIAEIGDFDDDHLLRVRIEETLELAKGLEGDQERLSVLSDVAAFVLKETKVRKDLEEIRERVQEAKRKRDLQALRQALYRFSLKL